MVQGIKTARVELQKSAQVYGKYPYWEEGAFSFTLTYFSRPKLLWYVEKNLGSGGYTIGLDKEDSA